MNETEEKRPGFLRRFFGLLIRTIFAVALLLLLVIGGMFLFNEAVNSSNNLRASLNAFESRVNLLRSDVDNIMATDREQRQTITQLRNDMAALELDVSSLANDVNRQNESLAALEVAIETAVSDNETTLASLQDGLLALQSDFNDSTSVVDTLGGELDSVRSDFASLRQEKQQLADDIQADLDDVQTNIDDVSDQAADALAQVGTNAAEMVELQRSVRLFRVWELITRTRLQLVEGNVGLATADLNQTLAVVAQMIALAEAEGDDPLAAELTAVQSRLELALGNLPASPQQSARDLETAWDLLDDLLADRLLFEFTLPDPEPTLESEEELEEESAEETEEAEEEEE